MPWYSTNKFLTKLKLSLISRNTSYSAPAKSSRRAASGNRDGNPGQQPSCRGIDFLPALCCRSAAVDAAALLATRAYHAPEASGSGDRRDAAYGCFHRLLQLAPYL